MKSVTILDDVREEGREEGREETLVASTQKLARFLREHGRLSEEEAEVKAKEILNN